MVALSPGDQTVVHKPGTAISLVQNPHSAMGTP